MDQGVLFEQVDSGQQNDHECRGGQHRNSDAEEGLHTAGTVDGSSLIQIIGNAVDTADVEDHVEADGRPNRCERDDKGGKTRVQRPFQRGAAQRTDDKVHEAVLLAEHPVDGDTNDQRTHQNGDIDHRAGQALL